MPTPPDPGQPPPGQVPEPVRVLRPRSFDALAELMREFRPDPVTFEPLGAAPAPPARTARPAEADTGPAEADTGPAEADTREIPPVRAPRRSSTPPAAPRPAPPRTAPPRSAPPRTAAVPGSGSGPRRAAVAVAVAAAALVGFAGALLLQGRQQAAATAAPSPPATTAPPKSAPSATTPSATAPSATRPAAPAPSPPASGAADPDGPGTLRQGDTGPGVTDLQQRLLRVPDVYRGGSASGTYDATLTEAVARFQLWYGISGDERGVYGDDTRRALESRTGIGNDA
ncbi:hypothetical protein GCM10018980_12290 [Streptomyces capoamus]|uniref:Peptidoglycan binding-like domain-containing protein n=1 Tax=Streptomyces capoamus TaxID=68183 RepID=A0A919C3N9_9ACTN|nr:peptidoglycan-binding domain-containing protein [Streptomyces capoamus]GGW14370.1 hypothetical protein GCM10010501_22160 [Streptomyces libani subsp. rufus]GHG39155.1 hypothetical protein GCM10018980_12290 [Streptomyces capoamus]